jgi:hypothetical protein
MDAAFLAIIVVVVVGGAIAGIWAAAGNAETYRQIGRGPMSLNDGTDRPTAEPGGPVAAAQREDEIRQMLEARNALRAARGRPTGDVEAELAELLNRTARPDPALEAEIRELVVARNARRARAGKPALDVETEVARRLRELR